MKLRSVQKIDEIKELAELQERIRRLSRTEKTLNKRIKKEYEGEKSVLAGDYVVLLSQRTSTAVDKKRLIADYGAKIRKYLKKSKYVMMEIRRV